MINLSIHNIMTYLIRTQGQLSEEQYMSMEDEGRELVYDTNLPVDIVFNKNDFFADISRLTQRDVSDMTSINGVSTVQPCRSIYRFLKK